MVQLDGLRPARLKVGVISAGRVGTALGVALERAEHVVVACSAISHASRQRAQRRLPDTPVVSPPGSRGHRRAAATGGSRQRTRRSGLRAGRDRCGAARHDRGAHGRRQRRRHSRAAGPRRMHTAGHPPGDDVHRLRRGHQPAAGHLLRDHRGRRSRVCDRAVAGLGNGRGAVSRPRGCPRPLPRCAGPRRQPHRGGARRCARRVTGRAERHRIARTATRRRPAGRPRRTRHRAVGPRGAGEHAATRPGRAHRPGRPR